MVSSIQAAEKLDLENITSRCFTASYVSGVNPIEGTNLYHLFAVRADQTHLGDANLVVNAWFVADDDSNPHVPFNGMFPDWQFFNVSKVHGMPNAPIKAH